MGAKVMNCFKHARGEPGDWATVVQYTMHIRVLPRIFLRRQAHPFHEYPSSPYLQSCFTEFVYCYGQ